MIKHKDGGAAFPGGEKYKITDYYGHTQECGKTPYYKGMTLRAWLAGQALASRGTYGANVRAKELAKECLEVADALIEELNNETP